MYTYIVKGVLVVMENNSLLLNARGHVRMCVCVRDDDKKNRIFIGFFKKKNFFYFTGKFLINDRWTKKKKISHNEIGIGRGILTRFRACAPTIIGFFPPHFTPQFISLWAARAATTNTTRPASVTTTTTAP